MERTSPLQWCPGSGPLRSASQGTPRPPCSCRGCRASAPCARSPLLPRARSSGLSQRTTMQRRPHPAANRRTSDSEEEIASPFHFTCGGEHAASAAPCRIARRRCRRSPGRCQCRHQAEGRSVRQAAADQSSTWWCVLSALGRRATSEDEAGHLHVRLGADENRRLLVLDVTCGGRAPFLG